MLIARFVSRASREAAKTVAPRKESSVGRRLRRYMHWSVMLACVVTAPAIHAQDGGGVEPFEEFGKHLRAAQEVKPLKSNLFGDQVSLYNGATEFNVTDIDLPGNSSLPVHLTRRLEIDDRRLPTGNLAGMGDWDLDVPYIDGVFTQQDDWTVVGAGQTQSYARCSAPAQPYTYQSATNDWAPTLLVWDGYQMHIPGGTSEELLVNSEAKLPAMTDGNTYPWITKSLYRAGCLGSTANGYPGEGFVVVTPSGVRYMFNWGVTHTDSNLTYSAPGPDAKTVRYTIARDRVFLLATQVTDRFGNWVKYTYNGDELTSITASDGREIDIAWSNGLVQTATAVSTANGSRTWTYAYTNGALSSVTQPDGSQWTYTTPSGSLKTVFTPQDNEPNQPQVMHCQIEPLANTGGLVYVVTSPSGATGTFNFTYGRQYRTYVPKSCVHTTDPISASYPTIYDFFDNFILTSKQITGAGLATQTWSYNYGSTAAPFYFEPSDVFAATNETYLPPGTCSTCPVSRLVTVTGPTDIQKYSFGVQYARNEGWLLQTETDELNGTVRKVEANTYLTEDQVGNEPFPGNAGQQIQVTVKNPLLNRIRPMTMTTISQDGDTYTHQATAFNAFAQVTETHRFNSITGQVAIDESTNYLNDTNLWVLALPQQVVNNSSGGEVESSNTYNTNDTLQSRSKFGQVLMSYGYDSQGNVSSVIDGNNHTTGLTNYKRGIPQSLAYPDSTTQTLVVDDFGEITSVTDQLGRTTQYSYDGLGRAVQIAYPTGDEVAWYPKNFFYTFVTSAERGLPASHWRRTITTGSNVVITYFDALLRPVLSDSDIGISVVSSTLANYDANGEKTFESYPAGSALGFTTTPGSAGINGTTTAYDALERVIQTQGDSELGTLTTATAYLAGAGKQITDPKGNVTTTYYQVFDEPKDDAIIQLQGGGITQTVGRDLYGNPLSITQSGLYGTENDVITKTLTYDSYHRLCRTTEPESGSTVMAYDGANNLAWSADGVAVTGTACGQEQVAAGAQTTRTYDPLNRLKTLVPPSGTQSTVYGYDLTGRLNSAVSGITTWAGTYNYRGLLTGESLQLTGQNAWGIGYAHDAYGTVSVIHYPTGENVNYAPDPLGRATQVGGYASGISYFPNGQVAQFVYGNGTSYVASQNTRQMLSNFSDGRGSTLQLSENLGYDKNGNLTTVNDLAGGPRSKTFGYDTLDRVTSAQAPSLWGSLNYTYDAINNLRSLQTATQTANYNYDATNRLTSITSGLSTLSTFLYDNRGNVSQRNGAALIFDLKNQLTQIQNHDSYAYDADGRRVQKTPQGGTPAYYFYSHGGQLMYSSNPSSDGGVNYIYLGKQLVARDTLAKPVPASAPTLSAPATNTTGAYTVSWSAVANTTTYTVQEKVGSGAWRTVQYATGLSWYASGHDTGSYSYQVQACNSFGCGPWSTPVSVTVLLPPATAPTLTLSASSLVSPSPVSYSMSWTTVTNATSYTLQEKVGSGAWSTVQATAAASWSASGRTTGTYGYQVQACNSSGCGPWSAVGTIAVTTPPTSAASLSLPVSSVTGNYAVSWTTVSGASSYTVQEKVGSGAWATVQTSGATSWSATGHAVGSYSYQVQACNAAGCAPWSTAATITVYPPPVLTGIGSYSDVSLTWTSDRSVYNLQESYNNGSWTTILQLTSNISAGLHTNPVGTYSFRVQACDSTGCGGWSNTVTLTTTPNPPVPALSGSGQYQALSLFWSSVAGSTTYALQESFNSGTWTTVQNTNNVSWGMNGLAIGTYSFRVQACNSSGCGAWSNVVTMTTTPTPPVPVLTGIGGNGGISLTWTSVAGSTTYNLQESINGGAWATVSNNNNVTWGMGGITTGTFSFRVQACNSSGCGAWSNTVTLVFNGTSQTTRPAKPQRSNPYEPKDGVLELYSHRYSSNERADKSWAARCFGSPDAHLANLKEAA